MRFMQATEGITQPHFSVDPLGTEAEMTPGPDDQNPYDAEDFGGASKGPDLPEFVGDDVPLAGDEVVGGLSMLAGERNDRLDAVFEFGDGAPGSFDPEPIEQGDQFMW